MESVWYYVINGAQNGPVSLAELKDAAASGKLSPTDLVWQEGTADWVAARTVAGLIPAAPPPPRSTPPAPPIYGLAPPPPPAENPSGDTAMLPTAPQPNAPEVLSLDGEPDPPPVSPSSAMSRSMSRGMAPRAKARDDSEDKPDGTAAGTPEWVNLAQVFARRTFNPDPSTTSPTADEEAKLTSAGVMDATARKFAVWRRSVLFVSAVPCAFAALFGFINVLAMNKEDREPFSAFGMLVLYVQAFALFALPVAAVLAALAYERLAASAKWVLIGGIVSFAVPLGVAFVPGDWLIDLKMGGTATVQQEAAAKSTIGLLLGITFYIALMPTVLSLLPAVARACVRLKLLLPESLVPGWGLVTSTPLCVLLTLATFVLLYHVVGNALLIIGLLLWVGAPLLYLTKFNLLTRPVSSPTDRAALASTSLGVLGLILLGMVILLIFLFTAKLGGKTLMGFDDTAFVRPWTLELHKTWIEYVGRSLFLTVFFADIMLRVALSVWREERAFAGSAEAGGFDRTMSGLGSAVLPRGSGTPT